MKSLHQLAWIPCALFLCVLSVSCNEAKFKVTVTTSPSTSAGGGASSGVSSCGAGRTCIATSAHGACAVAPSGTVKCWGLGNGSYGSTPVPISFLSAGTVLELRGGIHGNMVCALIQRPGGLNPVIECWAEDSGPLAVSYTDREIRHWSVESSRLVVHSADASGQETVVSISDQDQYIVAPRGVFNPTLAQLRSGDEHSCATMTDGGVFCWGTTNTDMMGPMGATAPDVATQIILADGTTPLTGIAQAAPGGMYTCFLRAAGSVSCWGSNDQGQTGGTGPGDTAFDATTGLMEVAGLSTAVEVAGGVYFACARLTSGGVSCWGALGTTSTSTPQGIAGISNAVAITAGKSVACAQLASGSYACWGSNNSGQLTGTGPSSWTTAVPVTGL